MPALCFGNLKPLNAPHMLFSCKPTIDSTQRLIILVWGAWSTLLNHKLSVWVYFSHYIYAQFTNVALCIHQTDAQELYTLQTTVSIIHWKVYPCKALLENGRQPWINLFSSKWRRAATTSAAAACQTKKVLSPPSHWKGQVQRSCSRTSMDLLSRVQLYQSCV